MKKMHLVAVLLMAMSCDRVVSISEDENSEVRFNFDCGEVAMTTKTMGGRLFWIYLNYRLREKITLSRDSLRIVVKSNSIPFKLYDGESEIDSELVVSGNRTLRVFFDLSGSKVPSRGDTIRLEGGTIRCLGRSITVGDVNFVIRKEFKVITSTKILIT